MAGPLRGGDRFEDAPADEGAPVGKEDRRRDDESDGIHAGGDLPHRSRMAETIGPVYTMGTVPGKAAPRPSPGPFKERRS